MRKLRKPGMWPEARKLDRMRCWDRGATVEKPRPMFPLPCWKASSEADAVGERKDLGARISLT